MTEHDMDIHDSDGYSRACPRCEAVDAVRNKYGNTEQGLLERIVDLEEAEAEREKAGGAVPIRLTGPVVADDKPTIMPRTAQVCPVCQGRGRVELPVNEHSTTGGLYTQSSPCHGCRGYGWVAV